MKVLDFGSLNYDFTYKVDHIITPGETQDSIGLSTSFGGKGLNQAISIAKAGVPVYMAGMVGVDGADFYQVCKENGVDPTYVKTIDGRSGNAIIQLDKNAQNSIILYGGANRAMTKEYVDEVLANFDEGDILVLQNEINCMDYIIDKAYEKKMTIILNPSPFDHNLDACDMSKISIFLLNEVEGHQLSGSTEPEAIIKAIQNKYPACRIVLTLGGDGCVYAEGDLRVRQGIYKVQAVDTTAAGDTFTGYFVAGLVDEMPIADTLKRCAKASAIAVSRAGAVASIPTVDEVAASDIMEV